MIANNKTSSIQMAVSSSIGGFRLLRRTSTTGGCDLPAGVSTAVTNVAGRPARLFDVDWGRGPTVCIASGSSILELAGGGVGVLVGISSTITDSPWFTVRGNTGSRPELSLSVELPSVATIGSGSMSKVVCWQWGQIQSLDLQSITLMEF